MRYKHPEYGNGKWEGFEEALSSLKKTENLFTLEEMVNMTGEQKLNALFVSPSRAIFTQDRQDYSESSSGYHIHRLVDLRNYLSSHGSISVHDISKTEILNLTHQERLNLSLLEESTFVHFHDGAAATDFTHFGILFNRRDIPIRKVIALSSKQYKALKLLRTTTIIAAYGASRESALSSNQFIFDDIIDFSETQIGLIRAFPCSAQQIIQFGDKKILKDYQLYALEKEEIRRLTKEGYISIDDFFSFKADTITMYRNIMMGDNLLAPFQCLEQDANSQNKLTLFQLTQQYIERGKGYNDFICCSRYLAPEDSVDNDESDFITVSRLLNLSGSQCRVINILRQINAFEKRLITLKNAFKLATDPVTFLKIVKLDNSVNLTRYDISHVFEFWYLINATDKLIEFFKNSHNAWKVQKGRNQIQMTLKKIHFVCLQYSLLEPEFKSDLSLEILSFLHPKNIFDISRPYGSLMMKRYRAKQSRFFLNAPIERFELGPDNVDVPGSETKNAI